MKLAVIGDTLHHLDGQGRLCALAPVAAQLDEWAALFDELVLCAVLADGPPPAGFAPYRASNVRIEPVRGGGGGTWRAKVGLVPLALHWWRRTRAAARAADALHFRAPCNVALVGLVATNRVRRDRYAHYAGAWRGYLVEPWTYRFQRWFLTHRFHGPVTVYADAPGRPHLIPFYSPSLRSEDHRRLGEAVETKLHRGDEAPLNLVTVGRLTANKNQGAVIEAVALLQSQGRYVHLDVVGEGPRRDELERQAQELGVDDSVRFHGAIDHGRVLDLLASAHVNVLATHQEGYGKVLLEGMSAGAVPVLGPSPMADEIAGRGCRGIVMPTTDASAVTAAVTALAEDPRRRRAMAKEGRDYAGARTLEQFRTDIAAILEEHWRRPTKRLNA